MLVAFGLADVASLRQFGVGLAIATLVRLVMMPAAMLFAGEWTWFTPRIGFDEEPAREPARPPHSHAHPVFDTPAFESGSSTP